MPLAMAQHMDVWTGTNWFVVQAKPFREDLGAASLEMLDIEVFLPRVKREQTVAGAPRPIVRPLFPGYFFARFCPLVSLDIVRYAQGVLRVIGSGSSPTPLGNGIIEALRSRLGDDGMIRLEPRRFVPGERVSIEQGPFSGWIARVERELDDGRRILVLLEAIQQARLLIDKQWLNHVSAAV